MFKLGEEDEIRQAVEKAEGNYIIEPNDWLKINLFTNEGEQLIDPNFESLGQSNISFQQQQRRDQFVYLVQINGVIKLPMIGEVEVAGLTINEAEKKLEDLFDEFYKGSFVKLVFQNKRVIVLGTQNMVVPIENENTQLPEVLALVGGVSFGAKSQNIKIIRGDLQNPQVFVIDMSEVGAMRKSMVTIYPNDIIYIEPWRRPWQETLRDISPILSLTSSVITLIFVIQNF